MLFPRGKLICTKPGNARRFYSPYARTVEEMLTNDVTFVFLCEDRAIAREARTIGKFEYNAGADIDRYALDCSRAEGELNRCPAYEKLRELVKVFVVDGRRLDRHAVTVDVDQDPGNGEVVVTRVCDGDGRCGPIAADCRERLEDWFFDLGKICESCDLQRFPGKTDADLRRPQGANSDDDRHEDPEKSKNVADVHDGSIPFFKRLIGRWK